MVGFSWVHLQSQEGEVMSLEADWRSKVNLHERWTVHEWLFLKQDLMGVI